VTTETTAALAKRLDVGLHSRGVCPACLGFVAIAHDHGDEPDVAREIRRAAPLVWDEGLGDSVRAALEAAVRTGDPDADEGLRDLKVSHARSAVFRAVVRRLAADLAESVRRADMASRN
jgi:hypothetical protein